MKLGEMLALYMKDRRLTTREVGAEVGCDHTTINRIVHGEPVRVDTLIRFISWLLAPTDK